MQVQTSRNPSIAELVLVMIGCFFCRGCGPTYVDPVFMKLYHYYGNLGVPFVMEQKMEHAEDDDSAQRFIRLIFEHDPLVRYDWQN